MVFDGVKMLDFVGPAEVFVEANQAVPRYEVVLISADGRDVQTSIGARVQVGCAAADADRFDTVVIPGSELPPEKFVTSELLAATRQLIGKTRRVASICSGAYVLAGLGLLDGRRATTHWKFAADLARRFPSIAVEPDAIFVRDGNLYSSAGVAAGMDLALALLEEDHGADLARQVAGGRAIAILGVTERADAAQPTAARRRRSDLRGSRISAYRAESRGPCQGQRSAPDPTVPDRTRTLTRRIRRVHPIRHGQGHIAYRLQRDRGGDGRGVRQQ